MADARPLKPDGTCSKAGLKTIEEMAGNGKPMSAIAAHFGYSKRKLQMWMDRNKGDNDIRLAYERGKAMDEAFIQENLRALASTRGNGALGALCFLAKTQHQWREVPEPKAQQVGIQIVIPGSYSREEWEKKQADGPPCFDVTPAKAISAE